MDKIVGIYYLPHALYCNKSCFGKCFEINVSNNKGYMYFPKLSSINSDQETKKYILVCPIEKFQWYNDVEKDGGTKWGKIVSFPDDEAYITQVVLLFENKSQSELQQIHDNLNSWHNKFDDIVCLLMQKSQYFSTLLMESMSPSIDFYEVKNVSKKRIHVINENKVTLCAQFDTSLNYSQCVEAINMTNEDKKITFEYYQYIKAIQSFDKGNYKDVIISCSVAIEKALNQKIVSVCKEKGISTKKLLKKYKMLGGMFDLSETLKITLPTSDYRDNINTLRNKVVHEGLEPNQSQTKKFLQDTKLYLDAYCKIME